MDLLTRAFGATAEVNLALDHRGNSKLNVEIVQTGSPTRV